MRYLNILLLAVLFATLPGCANKAPKTGDLRSAGTQLEDETIEKTAVARVEEKYEDSARVNVISINRFVLITGEATTDPIKTDIERIVHSVPNVKRTANEVSVGTLANSSSRRRDSGIGRDIRSGLNKNKSLRPKSIYVVADKGVVYLLGLVTHAEAATASEIASAADDVKRVVRVFEYID